MTKTASPTFDVEAGDLLAAIDRVKHAMGDDESRPILASFLVETTPDGEDIRLVAADNSRIAVQRLETAAFTDEWPRTVVSREGVPVLRDFLAMVGKDTTVKVTRSDLRLTVTSPTLSAEVRLVDGQYPDHGVVTDAEPGSIVAAFNPKYLAEAGRAGGKSPIVTIKATDPLKPVLITDGNGYTEWIMPVRVA